MKITLNTQELNQAVVEYLSNQGLTIDTNKVSILIDGEGVTIDTAVGTHTSTKPKKEKKLTKEEKLSMIEDLTKEMKEAAGNLDFERAMQLRDIIFELESE